MYTSTQTSKTSRAASTRQKPWTDTGFADLDKAVKEFLATEEPHERATHLRTALRLSIQHRASECLIKLSHLHKLTSREIQPDAVFDFTSANPPLQDDELEFVCQQISVHGAHVHTDLLLGFNPLSQAQVGHVGALLSDGNSPLRSLSLFNCNLDDTRLLALADALRTNRSLKSLNMLRNLNVGNDGIDALAHALTVNTTLQDLDLDVISSGIGFPKLCDSLATHASLKNLRVVLYSEDASPALGKLLTANTLHTLDLHCSAKSAGIWNGVAVSTNLIELSIRGMFGPEQAAAVATLLEREDCRLCSVDIHQFTAAAAASEPTLKMVNDAMASNRSLTSITVNSFKDLDGREGVCLEEIKQSATTNAALKKRLLENDAAQALGFFLAMSGHTLVPRDCAGEVIDALYRIDGEVGLRNLLDLAKGRP